MTKFTATIPRDVLGRVLKTLAGTVPTRSEHYGDNGVLVEARNGRVWLSGACSLGVTRVEMPEAQAPDDGTLLLDYSELVSQVNASTKKLINLATVKARRFPTHRFAPRIKRPPHAATIDGDHFRDELTQALRIAPQAPNVPETFGVRFWFEAEGVVMHTVDGRRATVRRVPAQVAKHAVGRQALVSPRELHAVQRGLTGREVKLGLSADNTLISLASGPTLLITTTGEPDARPWQKFVFTSVGEYKLINRHQALRALGRARYLRRHQWPIWWSDVVVVHLDSDDDRVRISHGSEKDPDKGRVLFLDPDEMRDALRSMPGKLILVATEDRRPGSRVVFLDPVAKIGNVDARHHVLHQGDDPRVRRPQRG